MQIDPPERIIGERVVVRAPRVGDGPALVDAVTASIEELRPWMPWIKHEPQTVEQREQWIADRLAARAEGTDFGYFSVDPADDGRIIGGTGLHLRNEPHQLEIGYWTHSAMVGRGICTEATRLLTTVALAQPGITEVLICCDVANHASAAIPAKLGYTMIAEYFREPEAPGETGKHLKWRMAAADWVASGF
jgi:RimJ/RimL family protein N-acetyltransferase